MCERWHHRGRDMVWKADDGIAYWLGIGKLINTVVVGGWRRRGVHLEESGLSS